MAPRKKAVKLRAASGARMTRFLLGPVGKTLLALLVVGVTLGVLSFTYYYVKYSRLIDQKLRAGPFANTSKIFAAPRTIAVGDRMTPEELVLRPAAKRIWRIARQPHGLVQRAGRRGRDLSRPGIVLRTGGRRSQVLRHAHREDHFLAGQHRSRPVSARTPPDHESVRPQSREAPLGQVRRYPPSADRRRGFRRRQAVLPARRFRPVPHREKPPSRT